MLVLSRKTEEELIIGNDVSIKVLDVQGKQVRLGIVAPKDIPIYRREVYDRIQKINTVDYANLPDPEKG